MGYLFLIVASLAGISKVVAMKQSGKVCPGEYNSVRINAFRASICGVVSVMAFLLSGAKSEGEYWWIWLLSGASNALMMFVWILCTQRISLIFVETFCLIGSTAIPMLISPLLYDGEVVNVWQWIGVICLLCAVVALSLKPNFARHAEEDAKRETNAELPAGKTKKKISLLTWIYILLLVLSNVGLSVTQKLYPVRAGSEYTAFFNLMTFLVVFGCFAAVLLFGKFFNKKGFLPENATSGKKLIVYVSVAAVMIYVYQYFSTLAAGILPSAIFYPLARGVSMCLTVACDVVVFKQKITKNVCIGLLFIFAAIVLTNL